MVALDGIKTTNHMNLHEFVNSRNALQSVPELEMVLARVIFIVE